MARSDYDRLNADRGRLERFWTGLTVPCPDGETNDHRENAQRLQRRRYLVQDGQPKTLDEIGKVYGVTRERIRQIESKTMSKLRHPSRSQVLRDYLD